MKARVYHFVAEELRTIAETMREPAARMTLESAASGYERLAQLEAWAAERLKRKLEGEGEP